MKKSSLIVVALTVLFAIAANAQHRVGVIGGINIANVKVADLDPGDVINNRHLLGIGGIFDFKLSNNAALRLEPMFLKKGATLQISDSFDTVDFKFGFSYLELPIFLKLDLGNRTFRPYVMAGPTIGFLLNSKLQIEVNGTEVDKTDIDSVTEGIDFALNFGAGISFEMGAKSIFVEGRYALGLKDIIADGTVEILGEQAEIDGNIKTKGIQFMAGITFPLGRGN